MGRSQIACTSDAMAGADILSVTGQRWRMRDHNASHALAIAQQLGLSELMGRILAGRGVAPGQAAAFLRPTLRELLPDPFHLKDMGKAARRIADAVTAKETLAIFGDYDVDGATSSALLIRYFRALGSEPLVHIPDRIKEGYGPNTPALLSLKERGAGIVITVDCGTMAFEPLAAAKAAGIDVIVADHHKGDARMPQAYAIVNPNRADEYSPHTQLAACGVTFLLMVAVNRLLKAAGVATPDLLPFLDLVALGTICDVVPLTGANRALVTQGLKVLRGRGNAGVAAAMDAASLAEAPGTYHAGFIIGPRINAGGRVGKSDLGVRLLATDDAAEAADIAQELNRFNAERKAIESLVLDEAMRDASALPPTDGMILVAREGWHPGVIGIVASRLKDHFHKPAAVIALSGGAGKASARSVAGLDLGALVVAATHHGLLLGGGGHAMAAGFSVAAEQLEPLRAFFNERLAAHAAPRERILHLDGAASLAGITPEFIRLSETAGPFGAGNPAVRLLLAQVRVVHSAVAGDGHIRAILSETGAGAGAGSLKAMAFRSLGTPLGDALMQPSRPPLHIAGHARLNHWQGRENADFFIDDVAFA